VKDSDGSVVRWFGTNTDITERKRAEVELQKLNRIHTAHSNSDQAILHATDEATFLKEVCRIITRDCGHAMVWIGIAEHDELKTVRPVANSGFDESYLETLGVTWDESERGCGPTGMAIRTGRPSVCRNMLTDPAFAPWREDAVKRGYASSLVISLKEGKEAWGAITIYSCEPDAFSEGEINLLTELAGDVEFGIQTLRLRAAHARAEEALLESTELLGLFVEYAPAALAMFDSEMRYLYASRRWMADFNLGDRDLRGVSHYEVVPEVPDEWKEAHRRGLAGEVLSSDADRFARADGSEQWIRREIRPWRNAEGEVGGIVIFSEEITARKKAEAALVRNEKLAFQRQQLQALAKRLQQVREEERKMVARDLHDDIGQILTAIKFDMTWVVRHLPQPENGLHKRLSASIELVNDGVKSVRKICTGLRPGILDDLGLAAAIEWQANEFTSRTGIPCQLSFPPAVLVLDGDRATTVFRIFQECLTNIARHAEAQAVDASLYTENEDLVLVVEDDGKGFRESEAGGSLGVLGMKERAAAWGGSVQISSSPGKGTQVTVRVPVQAASAEREDHEYSDS
jgi:PAS domain S-box-containing protein